MHDWSVVSPPADKFISQALPSSSLSRSQSRGKPDRVFCWYMQVATQQGLWRRGLKSCGDWRAGPYFKCALAGQHTYVVERLDGSGLATMELISCCEHTIMDMLAY